ncbi:RDD family protein [Mucilaginibacter pocheonensis]|uniref:RDD family membrane protein YckC n=1 Tax=Mucilaginibacter pocheonensis TaxID=398050 RepID=A0ABU1T9G1_9SPHI|nr:RDD family protein [Mucilaginibacter pocheonensis]MDR6942022.1 putative RDD family membrane protein YckC [Mucilaginibacter pocheonensis]
MLKKQLSAKSVVIICFAVPILGFLSEIYNRNYSYFIGAASDLASSLNLSWFNLWHSIFSNINVFNWIFYFLMLLGAIFLVASKGKETRLPRFGFALIIFHKALFSAYAIYTLFASTLSHRLSGTILFYVLYMLSRLVWIWLAWKVLEYFNKQKELETQTDTYGDEVSTSYVSASRQQRFMNLLIDMFMGILLFSVLIESLVYRDLHANILVKLYNVVGEKFTLIIVIAVCRLLYYIPFELLTGATPAKYFTETRVINNEGEKPGFGAVLKRSLARFIPFETFSFLMRDNGWHDRISGTAVIREKRTGVNGGRYLLIIPIGLMLWGLGYWSMEWYKDYKERTEYEVAQQRMKTDMLDKLEKINTNDFFELRSLGSDYYGGAPILLKVEKIAGDDVAFSVIPLNTNSSRTVSHTDIERTYEMFKDQNIYKKVSFKKQALRQAVRSPRSRETEANLGLLIGDRYYYIGSIDRYYEANIKLSDRISWGPHHIDIALLSVGWAADVTKISAEEGDIKFSTFAPLHLPSKGYGGSGYLFQIMGEMENGNDFKINLTLRDTLGRKQVYQLSGNCNDKNKVLTRLK